MFLLRYIFYIKHYERQPRVVICVDNLLGEPITINSGIYLSDFTRKSGTTRRRTHTREDAHEGFSAGGDNYEQKSCHEGFYAGGDNYEKKSCLREFLLVVTHSLHHPRIK